MKDARSMASLGLAAVVLLAGSVGAPAAEDAPKRHAIKKGKLDNVVELDAVLESAGMTALKVDPKVWTDLTVVECVPHGAQVRRGDIVLRLETEKLREQLADLRQSAPGEKLALELAEADLDNALKTAPLKLEAARRAQTRANEEYDYFVKTGREEREKGARWRVRNSEQNLRNETEELTQLQKMYDADDLTEETEEIILERQKNSVEAAKYYLDNAKLALDRELNTMIARAHQDLNNSKLESEFALALAERTHQKQLEQKRLNLEKQTRDRQKNQRKLADLENDLKMLTVEAPMDGIVYYGACESGKWPTAAAVAKKLTPGGKIGSREVFMTLVDPARLRLLTVVPEDKLAKVQVGMKGRAHPVAKPDLDLPARVEELSWVPLPTGGFASTLDVESNGKFRLMPGMNVKVKLRPGEAEETLLAPKEAVFGEEDDRHVWVYKEGEDAAKRKVQVGEASDKVVQIVEGLAEGDEILLKKPE